MRLSALALLSFLALPAAAEEPLPSCQLLLDSDLAAVMGGPALRVSSGGEAGASNCVWLMEGNDQVFVRLDFITAETHNVVGGTMLDYFRQIEAGDIAQLGAEKVLPIEGLGQDAYLITYDDAPLPAFGLHLLQNDDTIALSTQGLDMVRTIALGHLAASRAASF